MARGADPGTRRGGRVKGVPNKATVEVKEIARAYGPDAIKELAKLAGLIDGETKAESEQARIAALNGILDRGYGKPSQTVAGDPENPINVGGKVELVFVEPGKKV